SSPWTLSLNRKCATSPLFDMPTFSASTPSVTPFRPDWLISASPRARMRSRVDWAGLAMGPPKARPVVLVKHDRSFYHDERLSRRKSLDAALPAGARRTTGSTQDRPGKRPVDEPSPRTCPPAKRARGDSSTRPAGSKCTTIKVPAHTNPDHAR